MKNPISSRAWMAVALAILIIISCNKKDTQETNQVKKALDRQTVKMSGVAPDDPKALASIPLIVSNNFMQQQYQITKKSGGSTKVSPTPGTSDVTPPSISITSPLNGASLSGSENVTVNASDNVAVTSVTYTVDGNALISSTTSPFSVVWNTSTLADGLHTLTAIAYDAAGNSNSSSISVSKSTTIIASVTLPVSYQITTPIPRNQGVEGSCVSFAAVYAARSVEQYYNTNATSYSDAVNLFSPEYVFNQVNLSGTCSSSAVTTTLDLLRNMGVCTWQTMPYTDLGCSTQPNSIQNTEAANYKIASYSAVINSDQVAIKSLITNKHPVIFTCNIDQQFYDAYPGFIWKSFTTSAGSHCLVICGYDDSMHAYKAMNSWGTTWGDNGFIWIDYDFFSTVSSYYAYTLSL